MSNVFNKEQDAQATGLSSNDQLRTAIDQHRISVMDRYDLSPREREVANAILNGETRASAAQKLFISERTVKFHLENCYKKMGINSKNELIKLFYIRPE